jgi:DNA polymerase-1
VPASCVRDYLAICGDSSDNIPGISWIWPKKAQVLLNEFWSLEKIYDVVDNIESKYDNISQESQQVLKWKALEKFVEWKELAFLSQKLATLDCNMELSDFDLDEYTFVEAEIETPELIDFFKELEFFSLIPQDEIQKENWETSQKKVQIIGDNQWLSDLELDIYSNYKEIVIDTETTSLNVREAKLVWISILLDENKIYYINLMHRWPKVDHELTQKFIKKLLASDIRLIAHNFKYDLQIFEHFISWNQESEDNNIKEDFWQMQLGL